MEMVSQQEMRSGYGGDRKRRTCCGSNRRCEEGVERWSSTSALKGSMDRECKDFFIKKKNVLCVWLTLLVVLTCCEF